MTKEELKAHCIKQVKLCEMLAKHNREEPHGKIYEEHKLILELLEQQPCGDCISRQAVLESLKTDYSLIMFDSYGNLTFAGERIIEAIKGVPSVKPEKCSDCISRQAAIAEIRWEEEYGRIDTRKAIEVLKGLPSVEPERKKGKWIEKEGYDGDVYYDCSVCGNSWTTIDGTPWDNGMNYCPKCGARMEVQNE